MIDAVGGYAVCIQRPGIEAGETEKAFLKANKGFKYDFTIINDGSLDDLHVKAVEMMQEVMKQP